MATRSRKHIETLTHAEASRKNIPTAEHQPVMSEGGRTAIQVDDLLRQSQVGESIRRFCKV